MSVFQFTDEPKHTQNASIHTHVALVSELPTFFVETLLKRTRIDTYIAEDAATAAAQLKHGKREDIAFIQ